MKSAEQSAYILTDPRRFIGEISARYIGARPALSPELIPIRNRPMMINSYDEYIFETPIMINKRKINKTKKNVMTCGDIIFAFLSPMYVMVYIWIRLKINIFFFRYPRDRWTLTMSMTINYRSKFNQCNILINNNHGRICTSIFRWILNNYLKKSIFFFFLRST